MSNITIMKKNIKKITYAALLSAIIGFFVGILFLNSLLAGFVIGFIVSPLLFYGSIVIRNKTVFNTVA